MKKKINAPIVYPIALLMFSALAYLPFVGRIGFVNDDWYLIYDAFTQGPEIFHAVFASDRPARAFLQIFFYSIFREHILPYHISGYVIRLLGALTLYWILNKVWKLGALTNFLIALFFLIYPGFLMQINPVDYQAHLTALFLGMLSIAFSVQFLLSDAPLKKALMLTGGIITGWIYLGLMEWYIGLEYYRVFFMWLVVSSQDNSPWQRAALKSFKGWLPFMLIPLGFLFWRTFLFNSAREATDIGVQLGAFIESPIYTGLWWIVRFVRGFFSITIQAWSVPFYNLIAQLRLRDALSVLGIAIVPALSLLFALLRNQNRLAADEEAHPKTLKTAFWGGLVGVAVGFAPVIMVNREITFNDYSRYTIIGAVGSMIAMVTAIHYINSQRARALAFSVLLFIALATHNANANIKALDSESFKKFWWQVAWRAPQIEPGTTLVVRTPLTSISEDYITWGPANLIYYPQKQSEIPITIPLSGVVLTSENIQRIIIEQGENTIYRRGNISTQDFSKVIVISQPSVNACVHIQDGTRPAYSLDEAYDIMLVSPRSNLALIQTEATPSLPPQSIFGAEPEKNWCYFYQQAELARQRLDWTKVEKLGDTALDAGYYPSDRIEWMPFLQAYVALNKPERLERYVSIMGEFKFIRAQTCQILTQTALDTHPTDQNLLNYIKSSFCE